MGTRFPSKEKEEQLMQAFFEGAAGFGILLFLVLVIWKWGVRPLRPPKITESFDYHHHPEYRAQVDAHLALVASKPQATPYLAQIAQEVKILAQEKILPKLIPEKPASVEEPTQIGSEIDNLAVNNPPEYLKRIMKCIEDIYAAKDENGNPLRASLARDKFVPAIIKQVEWDYLIGPEVPGTKQPGIFRELDMIHNHALPESQQEVEHYFLLGYVGGYKDLPAVEEAVKAIAPWVVQEWREWQESQKGKK
jgi:hypothetical protein